MLIQVLPNVLVGDIFACAHSRHSPHLQLRSSHATVHAVKDPCHREAVGKVPATHPHYLSYEDTDDLYLNMIDAGPQFFRPELFWTTFRFIDQHRSEHPVIIHCNLGKSRAPALAMAYAAYTRATQAPEDFFDAYEWLLTANREFVVSAGLRMFLHAQWKEIVHGGHIPPQAA